MAVMDEFREEREKIKYADRKTKIEYYLGYYYIHMLAIFFIILTIGFLIFLVATKKEIVLNATFINCDTSNQRKDFIIMAEERIGVDRSKQKIALDTTINFDNKLEETQEMPVILKSMDLGQIDVLAANKSTFIYLANLGCFADIRETMTPEQIEKYKRAFVKITLDDKNVPVGIDLSILHGTRDVFKFGGKQSNVIGIAQNSKDYEKAVQFIETLDDFEGGIDIEW